VKLENFTNFANVTNLRNVKALSSASAAAVVVLCACAKPAATQTPTPVPTPTANQATLEARDSARHALVQPGFGTLKQDEFTLGIRSGALLVKVTPLNEGVIRLAAPDTYNRLHALAESRRATAAARTSDDDPDLFLVSFFSYQPDVTFQPEDLQLEYNGKLLRALIIPLTATWGKERMGQQETQAAIYVFTGDIDYEQPLIVNYGMDRNNEWQRVIPRLQVERGKIASRQQKQ